MKTEQQLRDKVREELIAVVDYRGSEAMKHMVALFDALLETYKSELITIDPAKLERKQGAAQQVKAIRDCIVSPDRNSSPRI
jgi:hypothetical protein